MTRGVIEDVGVVGMAVRCITGAGRGARAADFMCAQMRRACSYRFRHTLATEALELGGTIEGVADILGDSEAIVRKHYARWPGRQSRISGLLCGTIQGTIWGPREATVRKSSGVNGWDGGRHGIRKTGPN
jgi:hypothetical protein